MYSKSNVNETMPVRMEGDRKHNTAYKLTFADFIHGEGPQAIRATFNLELLQS
jgi:hypothetical protein